MAAEDSFDPLSIVESQGLLQSPQGSVDQQSLKAAAGADLSDAETFVAPVDIVPVTDAPASASDNATVYTADDHGFVTGVGTSGTNAGFIVLQDETAPSTYSFEIGAADASLTLNDDGSVTVTDAAGNFVNYIETPWARDADGRDLPTSYSVEGNILTQTVSTEGAAFPVVADPTTGCGPGWCSIYFNRNETKAIAAGGPTAATAIAAGCAAINFGFGGLCALGWGVAAAVAQGAYAAGNCLGWFYTPVGNNPFVEPRGTVHCP